MITLNLVSPKQKQFLKIKKLYGLLQNLLCILVIYSAILASVLIPVNNSVTNINEWLRSKKMEKELKDVNLTQKINELNQRMEIIYQVQNQFFNWSIYLKNLSELVPQNISLNNISSNLIERVMILKGYAKTRDSLLKFKSNLESSLYFTDINIPLSNFLTQEQITFEIKGKINPLATSTLAN